jgi:hypothetical protein
LAQTPLQRHGKTKRTRTFPKPQGASCLERKIKSKTEAAAYARLRNGYGGQAG